MLLPVSSYRAREVTRSVSVLPGLELSLLCSSAIKAKSWLLLQGLVVPSAWNTSPVPGNISALNGAGVPMALGLLSLIT